MTKGAEICTWMSFRSHRLGLRRNLFLLRAFAVEMYLTHYDLPPLAPPKIGGEPIQHKLAVSYPADLSISIFRYNTCHHSIMYYIGKILIFAPQNISTMKTKFFPLYIIICLLITTTAHAQWRELGGNNSLAADAFIDAVCRDASGNTYAAGDFTNGVNIFSGNKYVAKYNGTSWSELGGANALSANDVIKTICTDPSGNVYAAGEEGWGGGVERFSLPEADFGEGGEGGERRSYGKRSLSADVI